MGPCIVFPVTHWRSPTPMSHWIPMPRLSKKPNQYLKLASKASHPTLSSACPRTPARIDRMHFLKQIHSGSVIWQVSHAKAIGVSRDWQGMQSLHGSPALSIQPTQARASATGSWRSHPCIELRPCLFQGTAHLCGPNGNMPVPKSPCSSQPCFTHLDVL